MHAYLYFFRLSLSRSLILLWRTRAVNRMFREEPTRSATAAASDAGGLPTALLRQADTSDVVVVDLRQRARVANREKYGGIEQRRRRSGTSPRTLHLPRPTGGQDPRCRSGQSRQRNEEQREAAVDVRRAVRRALRVHGDHVDR